VTPDVTASDDLLLERKGAVLWMTLNRPKVFNALTRPMYGKIEETCAAVATDESIRVLVVTGAGEAFCAGADIEQFRSFSRVEDAIEYDALGNAAFSALENLRVPTIAAIRGACVGGGALIAGSCDLRIASPSARFGVPIARTLGNCLSGRDVSRLVSLLGVPRTLDLLLTARLLRSDEMQSAGLVSEVTSDEALLLPRAQALAERIAGLAPLTLRATKRAITELRRLEQRDERELLASCYLSEDFRDAVGSFLAGRPPQWKGR
jgi:enoyl-CoA hydratase/carnithine racemase